VRPSRVVMALLVAGGLGSAAFGEPAPSPGSLPADERPSPGSPPRPPDWDLAQIRDIFRFGDDVDRSPPPAVASTGVGLDTKAEAEPPPGPPPGPRLVGLIRGRDGLKAALAVQGEVVVLGRGESALGLTVVDVDEEGAVVRGPGDEDQHLSLEPTDAKR